MLLGGAVGMVAMVLAGCSTGAEGVSFSGSPSSTSTSTSTPATSTSGTTTTVQSTTVASGTQPSSQDEPMTLFEKRRLVARLQQDPNALQRLSPRERRELAAMVAAAKKKKDDRRD